MDWATPNPWLIFVASVFTGGLAGSVLTNLWALWRDSRRRVQEKRGQLLGAERELHLLREETMEYHSDLQGGRANLLLVPPLDLTRVDEGLRHLIRECPAEDMHELLEVVRMARAYNAKLRALAGHGNAMGGAQFGDQQKELAADLIWMSPRLLEAQRMIRKHAGVDPNPYAPLPGTSAAKRLRRSS